MDLDLYKLPQTIFTFKEISLLFPQISATSLKSRLFYMVKTGKLLSPRRGIYAKPNYNLFEFGNRIYSPSYISCQTVLEREGIIFQPHNAIFLVSYLSRRLDIAGKIFVYKKLKNEVLSNPLGIITENGYSIASKERAFLDIVFFLKDYHVDNKNRLDFAKIKEIMPIYKSKSLEERIKKYV